MNSNQKVFALIDCNSFYCSCERLFRPDLSRKAVGVLSNNDGCFVSRTQELKQLGVKMGEPYFKVKDLCQKNNVAIFSANFSLYTDLSNRVMSVLKRFSPHMEVYSIDEAFLDLSSIPIQKVEEYGRFIKKTIEQWVGIPVSIGIASTKTLSKVANYHAKKNSLYQGVCSLLKQSKSNTLLKETSISEVWGVGRKSSIKFKAIGIKTAFDLKSYPNDQVIQKVFTKVGRQTQDELRGISCLQIANSLSKKQEIISSRSFARPVYDQWPLQEAIANFASLACEKLRRQQSVCSQIEVKIRTGAFNFDKRHYATRSLSLQEATSDTRKVIKYAWKALDQIYQHGYEYKKAQIKLSNLTDQDCQQLSLFTMEDSLNSLKLMKVMDHINHQFGSQVLKSMACGTDSIAWKMRQKMRSPQYLSSWSDLPKVC